MYAIQILLKIKVGVPLPLQHRDVWGSIYTLILGQPVGYYLFSWTKGHATEQQVRQGKVTKINREGNNAADEAATMAAQMIGVTKTIIAGLEQSDKHFQAMHRSMIQSVKIHNFIASKKMSKGKPKEDFTDSDHLAHDFEDRIGEYLDGNMFPFLSRRFGEP